MSTPTPADALTQFTWHRQPEAERLVRELVERFLAHCPEAATLAERMRTETGTRFIDWVDYITVAQHLNMSERIAAAGYVAKPEFAPKHTTCFIHPGGVFPLILVSVDRNAPDIELGIKVDSVADFAYADFASANDFFVAADGMPFWPVRRLLIQARDQASFYAVERHGHRGFNPPAPATFDWCLPALAHLEYFRCRRRHGRSDDEAFDRLERHIDSAVKTVGQDAACDLFFTAEREYWQRRNRAAQFQKARQDKLGLGWANHDHHTYRSSRKHFARLIRLWEKLGFQLRERFYAGAEAGWGAQVAEQPNTGIVTFNDVDLSPDELLNDFSHEELPDRNELGTVGLWCALHGESVLQAGMHHLECQFDFDSLKEQLERDANIKVMKPFTDFPYLRQAFTEGERWPVAEERLQRLLDHHQITPDQAQKFREQGAIGSHLENLERNEGFKGFNQKGVSEIISRVDPRKQMGS